MAEIRQGEMPEFKKLCVYVYDNQAEMRWQSENLTGGSSLPP